MAKLQKTKDRVLALLDAIGDGIELVMLTHRYQKIFMYEGLEGVRRARDAAEHRALRQRIAYLKRKKLVREARRGEKIVYLLTDAGRRRLLGTNIRQAPVRNDGRLTVVIFDIPESERGVRDVFRRFLRESGFYKIQQSIWASEREVAALLVEFVQQHDLTPWINVIEGTPLFKVHGNKK